MKKLIALLTLVLVFSLTANAQKQKSGKKGSQTNLTAEQVATVQTKKLDLLLDLNESQNDKIYTIFKKQAEDREAARAEMQKRRTTGTRPTEEERFAFQNERLDRQIAHKAEMKKILNSDQFEKWEEFQEMRRQKGNKFNTKGKDGNGSQKNNRRN
ncbi:hypothetical protein R3X25_07285 [Lutibacter sp. TH_r2]|uniref:hypothetical protein n=1 Tax=Lutibacter sp. TH_r2 TaxID=3082083 RepID=UPI002953B2CB|nr:hypothetical protein [Lutibacter sp. TH_r2]MDV7187080.1 hypothetical protein [Lutibacter sp. TH_r2]